MAGSSDMSTSEEYIQAVERALDAPRPSGAPEYIWIGVVPGLGNVQRCECGALVKLADEEAHNRFHDILNDHALVLAVLQTSHIAQHVHDAYDVHERIEARRKPVT